MSATAFQRARREAAALKKAEVTASSIDANSQESDKVSDSDVCLDGMTVQGLKALCDERGIKYKSKATKEELIKILEG